MSDTWTTKHHPPSPERIESEAKAAYEREYPTARWQDLSGSLKALWRERVRTNGDMPPR